MKKQSTKTSVVSASDARARFGEILRRAGSQNERFLVNRNGEPSVIIMSVTDYMNVYAPEPNWLAGIRARSKARGTNRFSMNELDSVISEVRRSTKLRPASKS